DAIQATPSITIPELSQLIGVTERSIERNLQSLQTRGRIRRIGPAKGGHWEVIE
ncbi:MAG: HTH domain-containing protein, partial [Desulfuromonadales bacterium]|nr:HTH domain-containing protein [Desulfuromonadales bacterium]